MNDQELSKILTNHGLAQFGDALLNFAYSLSETQASGKPMGTKVKDQVLAEAAANAGLRKLLPRRVGRGEVANSVEALAAHCWLEKRLTLDEIVSCLKESSMKPAENFTRLAELALAKLRE